MVPEAIDRICRKALAKSADDRYANAEEFRLELEQFLAESGKLVDARRRLGPAVSELFKDKRSEIKTVIEKQLAALRADLPAAISFYRKAANDPAARLGEAEAQLAAGLAFDAKELLDQLMSDRRTARAGHDLAVAEHRAAVAAFLEENFPLASELARSANRRFTRREDHRWAAISALTRMRAELAMAKPPTR